MFIISQLLFCDLSALTHGTVLSDLFQSEKIRSGIHHPSGNNNGRNVHSSHAHQMCRHAFVTACNKNPSVERRGVGVDLDHICDHIPGSKGIIDPVMSLGFPVADVRGKVSGPMSSGLGHSFSGLFHQFQQMSAAWVAVPESTLDHDLGF